MDNAELLAGQDEEAKQPVRLLASFPSSMYGDMVVRYPYQEVSDYAYAYHESAKRLASTFSGRTEDDTILIPFLMLYRHAYELCLKHLAAYLAGVRRRYREPFTADLEPAKMQKRLRFEHGHRLAPLLAEVQEHFAALSLPSDFPASVVETIDLLHEADGTGMRFRYAHQLPDTQEHMNFLALAAVLDDQLETLATIEDYVDGLFRYVPDDYTY